MKKKQLILLLILVLAEILMTVTGTGYIMTGKVSITLMQIPVILAAVLLGLPSGLLLGGLFGLSSLCTALWIVPDGSMDALFRNPLLSVLPRLLFALFTWLAYRGACKIADDRTLSARLICGGFAAVAGVIMNALFVSLAYILLYPQELGITNNVRADTILVQYLFRSNIFYEILISALVTYAVILLCNRLGFFSADEASRTSGNIRKSFQKWLLLFLLLITSVVMNFVFTVLSAQDEQSARELLLESSENILAYSTESTSYPLEKNQIVSKSGSVLVAEGGRIVVSRNPDDYGRTLEEAGVRPGAVSPEECFETTFGGKSGLAVYISAGNTAVFSFLPIESIYTDRNRLILILYAVLLPLSLLLYFTVSGLVQGGVVRKVQLVNESLKKIRAGDLDEKVQVSGNVEFEELSDGINVTVDALKEHIAREAARIDQELSYARQIQASVLPALTGPVAEDPAFRIYACMDTAKEVGGDFYDFYFTASHKLAFLIADVSGKGIPAALFMMRGKAILRDCMLNSENTGTALSDANRRLYEGNETGTFITAWMGLLNPDSGELTFSNAGHNPPVLIRNGRACFLPLNQNLILGAVGDSEYVSRPMKLKKGDVLFLYTDGVTEALNRAGELFGESRLLRLLSEPLPEEEDVCKKTCRRVCEAVDAFAEGTPQADDITMLCLQYPGSTV